MVGRNSTFRPLRFRSLVEIARKPLCCCVAFLYEIYFVTKFFAKKVHLKFTLAFPVAVRPLWRLPHLPVILFAVSSRNHVAVVHLRRIKISHSQHLKLEEAFLFQVVIF